MASKDVKAAVAEEDAGEEEEDRLPDVHLAQSGDLLALCFDRALHLVQPSSASLLATLHSDQLVRAAAITAGGRYVLLAGDGKVVECFDVHTKSKVAVLTPPNGKKLVSVAVFDTTAVYADKAGDVQACDVPLCGNQRFVLGHVSVLTRIDWTPSHRYLVTSDGDEKLRVTKWPETYDIECFLLGHTEFVTTFAAVTVGDTEAVVSGSGDGTLRVWKLPEGTEVVAHAFPDTPTVLSVECIHLEGSTFIAVTTDGQNLVHFLRLHADLRLVREHELPTQGRALQLCFTPAAGLLWVVTDAAPHLACYRPAVGAGGLSVEPVALGGLPAQLALRVPTGTSTSSVRELQSKRQKREDVQRVTKLEAAHKGT